jgi:ubiquinone/menaquinone biosynthesis C-methylase UbiE
MKPPRRPGAEILTAMSDTKSNHFDNSAASWDREPRRIELAKAVGEAILRLVRPTADMDVMDYGCGTGLLGLFLLPHVRTVTGADNSPGILRVLEEKIRNGGLKQMRAERLDLQNDRIPEARYHLIVVNMVMHHVKRIDALLAAFHRMLLPGGFVAIADLDPDKGLFHQPEAAQSVYHNGFDRGAFKAELVRAGFIDVRDVTAHVVRKLDTNGEMREFSVFLIVGCRKTHQ